MSLKRTVASTLMLARCLRASTVGKPQIASNRACCLRRPHMINEKIPHANRVAAE